MLQLNGFSGHRQISLEELTLNLVELSQLLLELLFFHLINHVSLIVKLLETTAKALINHGFLSFHIEIAF